MSAATSPPNRPGSRLTNWSRFTPVVRKQLVIMMILLLVTFSAWVVSVNQSQTMSMGISAPDPDRAMTTVGEQAMTGMAGSGWSLRDGWSFLTSWTVMMAAMMLPAVTPMLLLFSRVHGQRRPGSGISIATWVFTAGYLLVWSAIGVGVYGIVQLGSYLTAALSSSERATWAPIALGTTLLAAGAYQLTPLKRVCLAHCRTPLGYLMDHWHDGTAGALRMGIHHGAYCLGCCWALFAVMVAAGVMSLGWMILLSLIVFIEKVFSFGQRLANGVGIAMAGLGILIGSGVVAMPWVA